MIGRVALRGQFGHAEKLEGAVRAVQGDVWVAIFQVRRLVAKQYLCFR